MFHPPSPTVRCAAALLLIACGAGAGAQDDAHNRTVVGPTNPDLFEGSQRLLAGDNEEGIRRTRLGLAVATSTRERLAGLSNLCAGYLSLEQWETALGYCNQAIEMDGQYWSALANRAVVYTRLGRYDEAGADLDAAEALAPEAPMLRLARSQWRDATDPVKPTVIIDERRETETE